MPGDETPVSVHDSQGDGWSVGPAPGGPEGASAPPREPMGPDETPIRCSELGVAFTRGSRRTMLRASLRRALRAVRGEAASGSSAATLWALRRVSFSLRSGASLAVCGDNGAGKTTLLRTMSGIYQPDEGSIEVRGRTSVLLSLGATLDARLSGRHNVLLAGALHGIGRKGMTEHVRAVQDFAELDDATMAMPVRYYSAGMRLRLAFATASVLVPEILLIDEMLGVGDAGFRLKSVARLRQLTDAARCVVICSHNVRFLRENCDRALWLDQGKLMAFGDADEVLDAYRDYSTLREGQRARKLAVGPLPPRADGPPEAAVERPASERSGGERPAVPGPAGARPAPPADGVTLRGTAARTGPGRPAAGGAAEAGAEEASGSAGAS